MNINHQLFDSGSTDQVAIADNGTALVELRRNGMQVRGQVRTDERKFSDFLNLGSNCEYGFSRCAARSYHNPEGQEEVEALFVSIARNTIERICTRGVRVALDLCIDASCVTCLRTSQDGRYVVVGNGQEQFEVFGMDMDPNCYRTFSFGFIGEGSIADLCMSRTNLELFVANSCGGLAWFDLPSDELHVLHSEEMRWPCYSIDGQKEGDGVVFGGEGPALWMLGVKGLGMDKRVPRHAIPFHLEEAHNVAGTKFLRVAGMPRASLGCLLTGVGSYVSQVRFLDDHLICVLGPEATEVWDISGEEPRVVARRTHDVDCRLLGFGGDVENVFVSLGRPF